MQILKAGLLILFIGMAAGVQAQQDFSKLDSWLDRNVKEMGGRAILVISKDGRIVYNRSVNEMSRRQKMVNRFVSKKMSRDVDNSDYTLSSRQPVASCSKWFSAALVMTFVDEGRLSLSDTVGKYLPVLTAHGKGNITLGQCLSHLTGINEPPIKESLKTMIRMHSMEEAIAWIAALPMEGAPGTVFHYSNAGLQIAGAVLEKISGKSFEVLFAERITRPLGMQHTDFGMGPVAMPAGGAGSTPEDFEKFLEMIRAGGTYNGRQILSRRSVSEMQINRITKDIRIGYSPAGEGEKADGRSGMGSIGYGYGEWVFLDPLTKAPTGSVTSPGLFGSIPIVDNKRGYSAFLMTFYLKHDGRVARMKELKQAMDEVMK